MSNGSRTVTLEDATFNELKTYATEVMGIEVSRMASKPEGVIAKMKAVDENITEFEILDDEPEVAYCPPEAPSTSGDEWSQMTDPSGKPIAMEWNGKTQKTRPLYFEVTAEHKAEDLIWITITEEVTSGNQKSRDVYVGHNGKQLNIPRGYPVPIRRKFLNVLASAIQQTFGYQEINGRDELVPSESPIYPYSVHGTVKEIGVNFGGPRGLKLLQTVCNTEEFVALTG